VLMLIMISTFPTYFGSVSMDDLFRNVYPQVSL
jgi:hypothetical protein